MSKWKDLGSLLREYGLISNDDLNEGLAVHREQGIRLGEALVQLGKISMEDIDWVLSKQLDVPYVIVDDVTVDNQLLRKFSKDMLIDNKVLPLYETESDISIVLEDPFNTKAIEYMKETLNKEVSISTGSGSKIEELLKRAFRKVGIPDLVQAISAAVEKIRETSFYRMDFLLSEEACTISAFGCGIIREMAVVKGKFNGNDVFSSLDELSIPFLYEEAVSNDQHFLAVYPLTNGPDGFSVPAVMGQFGLVMPDETVFTNGQVHGVRRAFSMKSPLHGYPFLALSRCAGGNDRMIYTADAAPDGFDACYVKLSAPRPCPGCSGAGCASCNELGYAFEPIVGVYSSAELKEKMKEVWNGKD